MALNGSLLIVTGLLIACSWAQRDYKGTNKATFCGWRNKNGIDRKASRANTDNQTTQFGEFPWVVAIISTHKNDIGYSHNYICSGSLIASNVVLTTAYCLEGIAAHNLTVRAGEWDSLNDSEVLHHVNRSVKKIISHEEYSGGRYRFNDAALLILEEPFVWQKHIRPICLSSLLDKINYKLCFSTGWGHFEFFSQRQNQTILTKAAMSSITSKNCENYLRGTRAGQNFKLHYSVVCAGVKRDVDICHTDMGAPLVCKLKGVKNRYYQVGITSSILSCRRNRVPAMYASIQFLGPWIMGKLSAEGISLKEIST